jgi:hypothetical protein
MAGERDLLWGADATDAQFRTGDDQPDDRFVLLEDTDAGTILLEWDDAAGEYVVRGPVNMDGNALDGVSDLTVNTSITDPTGTTYTDLAALAGIKFVQSTAPSSPAEGDTWGNPDTGVVKWWDGEAWVSDPPDVEFEALTFAESDLSVDLTETTISSESIELQSGSGSGSGITRESDDASDTGSGKHGLVINPNVDMGGDLELTISGNNSGFTTAYIQDASVGGTVYNTKDISGLNPGDSFTINIGTVLTSGQDYWVLMDADGSSMTHGKSNTTSFPYTSSDFDVTDTVRDGSDVITGSVYSYDAVTYTPIISTTGDAVVSWTSNMPPTDLAAWDAVWYQRTLDSETVTVDILDGTDTVLDDPDGNPLTDVPDGVDISHIDPAREIRVRANLSRADTANDPSFDSVTVTGVR